MSEAASYLRASVRSFVQLAGEKEGEEVKDWALQVKRDADGKGLFAIGLPLGKKGSAVEAKIVGVLDQDWRTSGKKEPRSYTLLLLDAARNVKAQECLSREAEPVTPDDIVSQGMQITLTALANAGEAQQQPFEQLKEVLTLKGEAIEEWKATNEILKGELVEARARIKALETEAQERTDELRRHRGQYAEAELFTAQAKKAEAEGQAALVVARSQATAIDNVSAAAVKAIPSLAGLAIKKLGGGKLGDAVSKALGGEGGGGAPDPKKVDRAKLLEVVKASKPFPPSLMAKIRALTLGDAELTRLLRWMWLLDPEVDALELLEDATGGAVFALAPEVHAHFTEKG